MSRRNDVVLIGFGFVTGVLATGVFLSVVSASSFERWAEAYGGLLGAIATLVGAAVVVQQIRISAAQFDAARNADHQRAEQLWKQTDGYVLNLIDDADAKLADVRRAVRERFPDYRLWQDVSEAPADGLIPEECLKEIFLEAGEELASRCSLPVENMFTRFSLKIHDLNQVAKRLSRIQELGPAFRVNPANRQAFLFEYLKALHAIYRARDLARLECERTRPIR